MKRHLFLVIILVSVAFLAYSEGMAQTEELEAEVIKVDKQLCLGKECKKKWPGLKCAEYTNRPKGESGDEYCESLGQVCTAVVLSGSGTAYFNECSTIPIAAHKTRCCWVE